MFLSVVTQPWTGTGPGMPMVVTGLTVPPRDASLIAPVEEGAQAGAMSTGNGTLYEGTGSLDDEVLRAQQRAATWANPSPSVDTTSSDMQALDQVAAQVDTDRQWVASSDSLPSYYNPKMFSRLAQMVYFTEVRFLPSNARISFEKGESGLYPGATAEAYDASDWYAAHAKWAPGIYEGTISHTLSEDALDNTNTTPKDAVKMTWSINNSDSAEMSVEAEIFSVLPVPNATLGNEGPTSWYASQGVDALIVPSTTMYALQQEFAAASRASPPLASEDPTTMLHEDVRDVSRTPYVREMPNAQVSLWLEV